MRVCQRAKTASSPDSLVWELCQLKLPDYIIWERLQWNPQSRTFWFIQVRSLWTQRKQLKFGGSIIMFPRNKHCPIHRGKLSTYWVSRAPHEQVPQSWRQIVLGACLDLPPSWGCYAGFNQSSFSARRLGVVCCKSSKKRPLDREELSKGHLRTVMIGPICR